MNIFGACGNLFRYLTLSSQPESRRAAASTDDVADNDNDGPGAGGGYDDSVDVGDADGPGAGGGYDKIDSPSDGPADTGDADGPGAGGGYKPDYSDSYYDGPGAGGGYFKVSGGLGDTWTSTANYLGQEWFMGDATPKAANTNKRPTSGKGKSE
ncbi:MAG: hypothetical protein WC314_08470 [Vulcanimicrobiota bacterium]